MRLSRGIRRTAPKQVTETGENDSDEILTQALLADVIDQGVPFGLT